MPAAKRAAPKETKMPERAKKAAKKEAAAPSSREIENVKSEFQKECELILAILEEDGASIPQSAKDMLSVAIPFALETPKADRHEFQEQTVNMLSDLFDGVKVQNIEKVKDFETKASEADTDLSGQQQAFEDARLKEADEKAARDAAEKALQESTKSLSDAKKDTVEASKQLDAFKVEKEQFIAEKAQREEFINNSWAKLKDAGLKGAELRAGNKQLMSIVTSLDGEESLKLALPVALKSKPDQRGMIGLKAIETTEEVLQESLRDMDTKIEDKDSEIGKQHNLVAEKTAVIESARTILEEKQNSLIEVENSLMKAKEDIANKKETLQQVEGASKSNRDELHSAQEKLQQISSLLERFVAIVKCGELATKEKEDITMEIEAHAETAEDRAPEPVPDTVEEGTAEA